MPAFADLPLANVQFLRQPADHLLQCTKGAEPAAEQAAPPKEQADEGKGPEDENHRVHQKHRDLEAMPEREQQGENIDHRELALGVEPDEQQGEQQETGAQQMKAAGVPADPLLIDE